MRRPIYIVLFLVLLAIIRFAVVPLLPESIGNWIDGIIGGILSLACSCFWLLVWFAPGAIYRLRDDFDEIWERLKGRRSEIDDLKQRIHHLNKPHHMAQLGCIFQRQGRYNQAADWFAKALEQDASLIDARYRLALCRMRQKKYNEAATLLEEVHAVKPDHDYGGAYLRLAQASELAGNDERASEVYPMLFKCCPGHAEGCHGYGMLLARRGDLPSARLEMEQVILSVRNSPTFHRRRNRHWMWKARWWLWKHRNG